MRVYTTDKELLKAICAHKVKQLFIVTESGKSFDRVYIDTITLMYYVSHWCIDDNGTVHKTVSTISHADACNLSDAYVRATRSIRNMPDNIIDDILEACDKHIADATSYIEREYYSVLKKNTLFMLDDNRIH